MKKYRIIFQPMGVRADVQDGQTVFDAARKAGVPLRSICGQRITCGKCRVIVQRGEFHKDKIVSVDDHLSPLSQKEREYWQKRAKGLIAQGEDPTAVRLACQARIHGDVVVMVPESSRTVRQVIRKAARERTIELRPALRKIYVELEPATLANPRGDWTRLRAALLELDPMTRGIEDVPLDPERLKIDLLALRSLQAAVREGDWAVTVTVRHGREVVRVEPGYNDNLVGLAIDIGTTTIAGYLCDLNNGEILASVDQINPQLGYGEDIMSRISYTLDNPDGLVTLHRELIKAVNQLCRRAAREAGLKADQIMELVVFGNSVMHHLFLGLDPQELSRAPFVPVLNGSVDIFAREIGLTVVNQGAYVHTLPLIASFVGADCMGMILAEAPHEQDENWLLIDVGTNAEIVLGNREWLICTSTPTGPAFEGAHISSGLRATQGAIEQVEIPGKDSAGRFKVIGSEEWYGLNVGESPNARGICGSGIIEAVAELYRSGLVLANGRFADVDSAALKQTENGTVFLLAKADQTAIGEDIVVTQDDIRQIQLAKAPLYAAAHFLLQEKGLTSPDRILLAGGFGSYIDPLKAMLIGMIPDCEIERVHAVGNAAGDGARIALLNREKRKEAKDLLERIERIELPVQNEFQNQFTLALTLPHMTDPYPHLEGIAPPRVPDPRTQELFGDSTD